ncbi:MAG: fasciclin domain-containing protein [Streptosporangiaceae bacterium]
MKVRILAVSAVAAGLAVGTAACSSSGGTSASSSAAAKSSSSAMASSSASAMPSSPGPASASDFGSGCASVPKSGAGSFSGMSTAPVATAASANPVLSTLVAAVKQADLVDTLNSAPNITVFAPANSAFAKIPSATLNSVLANKAELTKILTYHVAAGRYTPAELASGKPIKTLEGATVKPALSGGTYSVNGAHVVCGNVQTANATVYIIGTVMMPPSS